MTNEEALSILHCPDTVGGLYSEKYGEAINMAMEALKREPCEDAISRQTVIDDIQSNWDWETVDGITATTVLKQVITDITNMPSVTLQEPKTGHWMDRFPAKECKCSVCDFLICISNGSYIDMVGQMKYCPNCGARMVEPQESEDKE